MINDQTACHLVELAVRAIEAGGQDFPGVVDSLPAAIYVTDSDGTITYFNHACIALAGREPRIGVDKWCVTWKLYTTEGELLPHEHCPMAVAVRERREVRGAEAIAERPDGSQFHFVPYPTPMFAADGVFAGAVNLLREVAAPQRPEYLLEYAERCRGLAAAVQKLETAAQSLETADALAQLAATYEEQAACLTRQAHELLAEFGYPRRRRDTLQ